MRGPHMRNHRSLVALAVALAVPGAVGACSVLNAFGPVRDTEPSDPGGAGAAGTAGTGGTAGTAGRGGTAGAGGTGGTAGTGGSGGTPSRSCESSLDCADQGVCGPELVCVDCVSPADCADEHSCVDYHCRPTCDSDRDCVSAGLLCDKSKAYCVECLAHAQCKDEQHCASGSCQADLCVGGTSTCREGAVVECSESGDGTGAPSACGSRQSCVEAQGEASCTDWRCTAGAVECANNEVVTCSADGLTVLSTVGCGAKQSCAGGACRDRSCEPSTRFCKPDGLYDCSADGLSSVLVRSCDGGQYCDDVGVPSCKTGVCAPNQPWCDGNAATVCNANGSGFTADRRNCGTDLCVAGVCKTPACATAALKCQSEDVFECAADRLSWALKEDCASGTYCDAAASPQCKAWACTPNQRVCEDNTPKTCNANGSGYATTETPCGTDLCVAGACETPACASAALKCQSEDVYECAADRLSWTRKQDCASGFYCDVASPACKAWVCTPNQPVCEGTKTKVCNANGSGYLAGGTDCKDSGKVCSAGSCVDAGTEGPSCAGGLDCGGVSCCKSIALPGGTYQMGRSTVSGASDYYSGGYSNELPEHPATVAGFSLDKFEVTVGRFRKFVEQYNGTPPAEGAGAHPLIAGTGWHSAWDGSLPATQTVLKTNLACDLNYRTWTDGLGAKERYAINCVNWFAAMAFCIWDGGRLPTEAEWEYAAAGGGENRLFPWGNQAPDGTRANFNGGSATPYRGVGSTPFGDGLWGQSDLAGGMWEWTYDWLDSGWYGKSSPCDNCANTMSAAVRVLRGGGWADGAQDLRAAHRSGGAPAYHYGGYVGFRCARNAP